MSKILFSSISKKFVMALAGLFLTHIFTGSSWYKPFASEERSGTI